MGYGSKAFAKCKPKLDQKDGPHQFFLIKKCFVHLLSPFFSLILGFIMVFRVYGVVILWGLEGWGGRGGEG
jgi:hypothetical protein